MAQLERDIIIERTKAGLESARRRGKILGAPKGIVRKINRKPYFMQNILKEGKLTVSEISERLDISIATYYKYLRYIGLSGQVRPYKKNYYYKYKAFLMDSLHIFV